MKHLKTYGLIVLGFIAVIGFRSLVRGENLYPRALDNIGSNILWSIAALVFIIRMEQWKAKK